MAPFRAPAQDRGVRFRKARHISVLTGRVAEHWENDGAGGSRRLQQPGGSARSGERRNATTAAARRAHPLSHQCQRPRQPGYRKGSGRGGKSGSCLQRSIIAMRCNAHLRIRRRSWVSG